MEEPGQWQVFFHRLQEYRSRIREQTDDVNATLAEQSSFSSQARNLEDILADEGYNQCFMIGSDATFGEEELTFESHGKGQTEICDYNTAKEKRTDTRRLLCMVGI